MPVDDQSEVIAFLSSAAAHGGAVVERIDSHTSVVFLTGRLAWKLKRAVRFDYVDFGTVERRRAMCEAEVVVNRRTAPDIYLGVSHVTREADGLLALDGGGTPVEPLVRMERFDQDGLFDRLASRDALDLALMTPLGRTVAEFHASAAVRADHGGAPGMAWVIDGNVRELGARPHDLVDEEVLRDLAQRSRAALADLTPLLDARRRDGWVRQCHGDLHLRNIVLRDGRPMLFDAIEFNERIGCIDVLYDLAFLLMDLWRRKLPRHANRVLNGYLSTPGPPDGMSLLPLFLSCRAAVRAKTSLAAADTQTTGARRESLQDLSREYLTMAAALLRPAAPRVLAIGGFSGSGKSSVAFEAAPAIGAVPGAVVVRSDEIRKRMHDVPDTSRLGPDAYTPSVSRRVYAELATRAVAYARAGHSVIVDAVFARADEREALARAMAGEAYPFAAVWLDAPEDVLVERVLARCGDASDADAAVVRRQVADAAGGIEWHAVDARGDLANVTSAVLDYFGAATAVRSAG